jgi:hypothetical protein
MDVGMHIHFWLQGNNRNSFFDFAMQFCAVQKLWVFSNLLQQILNGFENSQ